MDMTRHLDRLDRSLGELAIAWPMARKALETIMREVIRRNRVRNGLVYLQVTRGVARRDHVFPAAYGLRWWSPPRRIDPAVDRRSVPRPASRSITVPENRWDRVDIKTIGLLPNVLARQKAKVGGRQEAWFVDPDGTVKEGASTNAWIVTKDGKLVTRPAEHRILRGITRTTLVRRRRPARSEIEERDFTVDEAKARARGLHHRRHHRRHAGRGNRRRQPVANGHPGSVALSLRECLF